MNLSRITFHSKQFLKNLTGKCGSVTPENAFPLLNEFWPDPAASCFIQRPESWLKADPDLSVILAVFNDASRICRSVESVLNQRTKYSFEMIVINDGSTDDTAAMLHKYESLPNVTVIHQENRGLSGARNRGLEVCRGKYILFHDSDDTLLPGAIENLLSPAFSQDADLVAGGYLEENPQGVRSPGLHYSAEELPSGAISGMACGKVFRRALFANAQFPMGYWYEDSVVSQILLPAAQIVRCIESEVFACYQNDAGISTGSKGKPKSLDSLYITASLLKDKPMYYLPLDEEAYRHFLYMVLLTYQRTRQLETSAIYAVFQAQRKLRETYFSQIRLNTPLEKALLSGNYRSYVWQCETGWILQRFAK